MILECRCEDKKKKKSLSLSHCMPHFELEGLPFSPLCLLLNPPFILFYMRLFTLRETCLLETVMFAD